MKVKSESEVAQSCPTLRDPVYCSLPGSSVHGIFQARVLEWAAIYFSEKTEDSAVNAGMHVTQAARGCVRDTNQDQDKKMAYPRKLAGCKFIVSGGGSCFS